MEHTLPESSDGEDIPHSPPKPETGLAEDERQSEPDEERETAPEGEQQREAEEEQQREQQEERQGESKDLAADKAQAVLDEDEDQKGHDDSDVCARSEFTC